MRRRHAVLLAALSTVAAIAACTLNPQPLPPADFAGAATDSDASPRSDGGSFGTGPESPGTSDAAAGTTTAVTADSVTAATPAMRPTPTAAERAAARA
jgi:hypothetical protein